MKHLEISIYIFFYILTPPWLRFCDCDVLSASRTEGDHVNIIGLSTQRLSTVRSIILPINLQILKNCHFKDKIDYKTQIFDDEKKHILAFSFLAFGTGGPFIRKIVHDM